MSCSEASCLVTHLRAYVDLSDTDRELLVELEREERKYPAETRVQSRGETLRELFVVKRGWLYRSTDLTDGRRHVVHLHHPGDVIGLADLGTGNIATHLTSCTDSCLCPFARDAIKRILTDAPRLGALLLALSARKQIVLIDQLRAVGRMVAKDRLLFLLLTLLHRLRVTDRTMLDSFELPLNQTQIGDMLGLTNVSVSKAFVELEAEGWLSRERQRVTLHEVGQMIARTEFLDRFTRLDVSWFPSRRPS